jgi:peptidoglycan hydrolase-like protein with peptidoglycan-binding domain
MSRSIWAAAGASMFAFALTPGAALAAGGGSSTARPASAHAKQSTHPRRRPEAIRRLQHSAARADAPRRAAALLAPGSGYQQAAGSGRVRALQRRLAGSGFAPGPIDGRYGPLTTHAVIGFQAAQRLRVDGLAGPETLTQLLRVTARAGARSRRAHLTPPASAAARSPRPAAARPSAPGPLLRTAQDPVVTKSLPSSPVATVPVSGGWPVFWLMLAGVTAAGGVLVGVALRRRSRVLPRRRRNISPRTLAIARLAGFRYCRDREAYVLRLVGNRFGPVLRTTPSGLRQSPPHTPRLSTVRHHWRRFQRHARS